MSESFSGKQLADSLVEALALEGYTVSRDLFQFQDARKITSKDALSEVLPTTDDKVLILTHFNEDCNRHLLEVIGIRGNDAAPSLLVRAVGTSRNRTVYHLVSGPPVDEPCSTSDDSVTSPQLFARTVALNWGLSADVSPDPETAPTARWVFSQSYKFKPSGKKKHGYTPPDDQKISGHVTFTIDGYADHANNGDVQWLVVEMTGHQETNTMATDKYNHKGWGNAWVKARMERPPLAESHSSSPVNVNNSKTVTTSVSFSLSKSPSASVGMSTQKDITDWKVKLLSPDSWLYEQSSPFNGTKAEDSEVPVSAYKPSGLKYELKKWPALTTNVFDWTTMSVWILQPATTKEIDISFPLEFGAMLYRVKTQVVPGLPSVPIPDAWPFRKEIQPSYKIDMSQVLD